MPISRNVVLALVAPVAIVAFEGLAMAQAVQDVAPYYAVVTRKIPMRCGTGESFYRVSELEPGTVVYVDGESQVWDRISYPAGSFAFVRVEDVQVEGTNATLKNDSGLKAANLTSGWAGSWQVLLKSPLPKGTALKVVEPVKEGEVVVGYKVTAPESARAYVESTSLRHATDTEVSDFKAKGSLPTLLVTTPKPESPAPAAGEGVKPAPEGVKPATDLTTPPAAPKAGDQPTTPPEVVPTIQQKAATPGAKPEPGTPESTPVDPAARRVGTLDQLEQTFQAVWKQPILSAEFDEAIVEIDRAMAGEKDQFRRRALQQRRDALEVRREAQSTMRRQQADRDKLDKTGTKIATQLAELERNRYYTIIGQLQPSTVYDGQRLPQMYRVVSVGGTAPRTLGYLRQSDKFDLNKMLGLVIGVVGDSQLDRSLQLNIITPVYVDVLRSTPAGELQAPSPAPRTDMPQSPSRREPASGAEPAAPSDGK